MPKATIITKEIIIEAAFQIARSEGFNALSARNIAQKIGCSTQPIYWAYKNMDDLKQEVCKKALLYLENAMSEYQKTDNQFLNIGLGYVRIAHTEPALFKAFYIDNVMNIKSTDIFPDSQKIVEIMKNTDEYKKLSDEGVKNIIAKSWMLAHGIASLVATGLFVYDEEKVKQILE